MGWEGQMKITDRIYLIASGRAGFSLTNRYDCSVYLIDCGGKYIVIDAGVGVETERIINVIQSDGLDYHHVEKILLTHAHGDHAGGAAALSEICSAEVYAMTPAADYVAKGDTDAMSLSNAIAANIYEQNYCFHPCPTTALSDSDVIRLGDIELTVLETEGHSAGHCSYLLSYENEKYLFDGDAVLCGGKICLQAIWDCDLQKYIKTVEKLNLIHPDKLFPGHGSFALREGWAHIEKAMDRINSLFLPKNAIGE